MTAAVSPTRLGLEGPWAPYAVRFTPTARQGGFGAGDDFYAFEVAVAGDRARIRLPEGFIVAATDEDCLTVGWRLSQAVEWLQRPREEEPMHTAPHFGGQIDQGWAWVTLGLCLASASLMLLALWQLAEIVAGLVGIVLRALGG